MTPDRIGKYKVVSLLGHGAMGEVYLGEDPYIGRRVAIKLVKGADPEARERFLHEARVVGGFSHPRIVLLLEFDFSGDQPFLVMEYLRGASLEDWMGATHALGEQLVILEDLFDALAYAHAQGVLHRDIKPSNLQVLPDGHAKLMDFGIARGGAGKLTATGTVLGTPNYMAPEILEDAEYSTRSDVYSAALLGYELLSGANPFAGNSVASTLNNVLRLEPEHLRAKRPEVPPALADMLMAGLSKDPARRPALSHLLAAVKAAHEHAQPAASVETQPIAPLGAPATPTAPPPDAAPRQLPPPDSWLSPGPALGVAALLAVVVVGLFIRSRVVERPAPEASSSLPPVSLAAVEPSATTGAPALPAPSAAAPPSPAATAPPRRAAEASPRRVGQVGAPDGTAASPAAGSVHPSAAPVPSPEAQRAPATPEPTPTPTPAARATPPLAAPPPTTLPAAQPPAVEAPAPELSTLSPRTVRRGSNPTVELHGTGFRAEHKVLALQGRRAASGVRVLRQQLVNAGLFRVQLLIEDDVPLGSYTLAVRAPDGAQSNSLVLEVVL